MDPSMMSSISPSDNILHVCPWSWRPLFSVNDIRETPWATRDILVDVTRFWFSLSFLSFKHSESCRRRLYLRLQSRVRILNSKGKKLTIMFRITILASLSQSVPNEFRQPAIWVGLRLLLLFVSRKFDSLFSPTPIPNIHLDPIRLMNRSSRMEQKNKIKILPYLEKIGYQFIYNYIFGPWQTKSIKFCTLYILSWHISFILYRLLVSKVIQSTKNIYICLCSIYMVMEDK